MALPPNYKIRRLQDGLSQSELAKKLGKKPTYIAKIENTGLYAPALDSVLSPLALPPSSVLTEVGEVLQTIRSGLPPTLPTLISALETLKPHPSILFRVGGRWTTFHETYTPSQFPVSGPVEVRGEPCIVRITRTTIEFTGGFTARYQRGQKSTWVHTAPTLAGGTSQPLPVSDIVGPSYLLDLLIS